MPASTPLFYRLRIRNAADSADLLIVTSSPAAGAAYISDPPSGDGTKLDIVTGDVQSGEYLVHVIDAVTGPTTRILTGLLADANGFPQLLSLKAFVEEGTDGTTFPTVLAAGFLSRLLLTDALVWEVHVSESQRAELQALAFQSYSQNFPKLTNLIGEPIKDGWGPIAPMGKTRFQVTSVTPLRVGLKYISGPLVVDQSNLSSTTDWPKITRIIHATIPFFNQKSDYLGEDPKVLGDFPRLCYELTNASTGAIVGQFTPVAAPAAVYWPVVGGGTIPGSTEDPSLPAQAFVYVYGATNIWVRWLASGPIAQPSVGDFFTVLLYPLDISETNPLHVDAHPVDIATAALSDAGIGYSATAAAALHAALGDGMRFRGRFTAPLSVADLLKTVLFGPLGCGARVNASAQRELIRTRQIPGAIPGAIIDVTSRRSEGGNPQGTAYDLDESTIYNQATFTIDQYSRFVSGSGTPAADYVIVTKSTYTISNGDIPTYSLREIAYPIPGYYRFISYPNFFIPVGADGVIPNGFYTELANEIFLRVGRGGLQQEFRFLRGVAGALGDFIQINQPDVPNAQVGASPVSQRGGLRVVQIIQFTADPAGPITRTLDGGPALQPSLAPTFTITALGADPERYAVLTLTNAAALVAAGVTSVQFQTATEAGTPVGGLYAGTILPAAPLPLTLPRALAGATLWASARSLQTGRIPSAWTAWASVTLTALPAVTGLAQSAGANDTQRLISWALGDTTVKVRIRWRVSGAFAYEFTKILLPGTILYTLTGLSPTVAYDVEVALVDEPPADGLSPVATISFTAGATYPTLTTPWGAAPFVGSQGPSGWNETNGEFGMQVIAADYPSVIELEAATETAVGSGSYGAYALVVTRNAVSGYRAKTILSAYAPNDGLRRQIRVRATFSGYTASAYTAVYTVNPWTALAPVMPAVAAPAVTIVSVAGGTIASPADFVSTAYTPPIDPTFDYVRYRIRQRVPGTTVWGQASYQAGGRDGSDLVGVNANVEVEIRLDTINIEGTIATGGAVVTTVTPPFADAFVYRLDGVAPMVQNDVITIVAEPNRMRLGFVPSIDVSRVAIFAKEYASGSAPATCPELDSGQGAPIFDRTVIPGQPYTAYFPRTLSTNYVGVEVIPYDRWNQRGVVIYAMNTPDPGTPVPTAPILAVNVSVPSAGATVPQSVVNAVTPASSLQQIIAYRNGLYEGAYGPFTAGVPQNISHAANSNAADAWEYVHIDGPVGGAFRESARTTAFLTQTPQLKVLNGLAGAPAVSLPYVTPDGVEYVAYNFTTDSDNPPSAIAILQRATSGAGPWSDVASSPTTWLPYLGGLAQVAAGVGTYILPSGTWYFRTLMRANGFTDSAVSATTGPIVVP